MGWKRLLVLAVIAFMILCRCSNKAADTCQYNEDLNNAWPYSLDNLTLNNCNSNKTVVIVGENYTGILRRTPFSQQSQCWCKLQVSNSNGGSWTDTNQCSEGTQGCANLSVLSYQPNGNESEADFWVWQDGQSYRVYLQKSLLSLLNLSLILLPGNQSCNITLNTRKTCMSAKFVADICRSENKRFVINITIGSTNCSQNITCAKCQIVEYPEMNFTLPEVGNTTSGISAAVAVQVMENLTQLLTLMGSKSSASITMGEAKGILVKTEDNTLSGSSFVISDSVMISDDEEAMQKYSRSVFVPQEALNKAISVNQNRTFLGVFLFPNMTKDAKNTSVLNNEVIAIDMGTGISNLTTCINITYRNVTKDGFKVICSAWNGEGNYPNWMSQGCNTSEDNNTITCQCNHLTFFAILMVDPNVNISSANLESLTYISYIGCGLSMFFLGIALFTHFILRKAKSNSASKILINLFVAMFLLDLTFLSNEWITSLGNPIGCKIMGAVMHYSLLSTFNCFAIEALHLCLHLVGALKLDTSHYVLRMCIVGWALPAVVVIILLCLGKYGQQTTNFGQSSNVTMCWITDILVHYIVNIGYYALVFLFTFTIFIIIVRRLVYFMGKTAGTSKAGTGRADILTVMGLCCLLGVTWGFAFLSYGPLTIPALYIFTILNSFQGFFLFIYYIKSNKATDGEESESCSSKQSATLHSMVGHNNPYAEQDRGPKHNQ
ncbi:adhesion G-protein coupled receptor G2-like isoform X2 [Brienomyrus brachyistius]|uniref:adhesion G-protein coupled receptor G2-like isoform X2 n=1 Tax=Brienomyrus brachyistius TaxID=42636 RepID=UPI0020B1B35A|nr:adhesion G-protein coupled receptor G2-like isoform X2 [Brienomyrus brachyistius]XP_048856528.1 adhesion G-protein coupled receptor G2-like isoform X2 [Brienomyrus brachyistius]